MKVTTYEIKTFSGVVLEKDTFRGFCDESTFRSVMRRILESYGGDVYCEYSWRGRKHLGTITNHLH